MRSLDEVRGPLRAHAPRLLEGQRRAAVAAVLHADVGDVRLLFIERARRLLDPWSGDMAFPGGGADPGDADARATVERETREEVGLDLRGAERLGRLDDLQAGVPVVAPFVLSTFVYGVDTLPPLQLNGEVQAALWVPASRLLDPAAHVGYRWAVFRFPGILVGQEARQVVWGLTYRLLERLFALAGSPLPRR